MARFQLVFRHHDGDRIELRANNMHEQPEIDGKPLVDGETYVIRGVEWLVQSDDIGAVRRFVCTPVAEPIVDGLIDLV